VPWLHFLLCSAGSHRFRPTSRIAQTAALAQAALQAGAQGATSASQQAGQNMKTVVDAHTERILLRHRAGHMERGSKKFPVSQGVPARTC
jgi:hypothetical protein